MPTFPFSDRSFFEIEADLGQEVPRNIPEGYVIEQINVQNRLGSVLCQYNAATFIFPIKEMGEESLYDH